MAPGESWQRGRHVDLSASEFDALFREVTNWGRWEERPEMGALNHLTAGRVAAANRLVRRGVTVTRGLPLNTQASVDNPQPVHHTMTLLPHVDIGFGRVRFAKDYVGVDYHNDGHSHIDALCHVAYDGVRYDETSTAGVTARGATVGAIDGLRDGLVGRGVLLDIPRARGVRWLEPGEYVFVDDLEAAEQQQAFRWTSVTSCSSAQDTRCASPSSAPGTRPKAGLHPETARFLRDRRVAALGSDGNGDAAPSATEGVAFPVHVLAINAMGMHLLDYLQFENLVPPCEHAGRWEFLFVAAPLRIVGGTGSPVNPIAVL